MLRSCLIILAMMFALILGTAPANAAGGDDAKHFVDDIGQKVLATMNAGGSEEQKQQQLKQMFTQTVDTDWMGKFVLGHAWSQANEDQRARYLKAYRDYLLMRYTSNFADYTGSKYTITGATDQGNGQYTVGMQIKTSTNDEDVVAGYRVQTADGQFKIVDIIVEGVSLITTERSEFNSVVQSGGLEKLISSLQEKTQAKAK